MKNRETLDKVLLFLFYSKSSYIDEETIRYFPEKFPFSHGEFQDLFYELDEISERQQEDCSDVFSECRAYFIIGSTKLIWRLLMGQGRALQLHFPSDWVPYKEELEIKIK
jgi:hypothetical protein